MIELQRLTGMRPGEVVTLRGRELDRSGNVWLYTPAQHKTAHRGHKRIVYLGPQAQDVLTPFLKFDPDAYILLSELRNDRRLGRRLDKGVPFRWRAEGVETVASPRLATTWSSVLRFWARRSGVTSIATTLRSAKHRQREISRAERELARQGL